MRAVVQRVRGASCRVGGEVTGGFSSLGLFVLLGITHDDTPEKANKMARKIAELRIFEAGADLEKKPVATSALEADLDVLVVSQFTLYGDTRKGRRPSWTNAAPAPIAQPLYEQVVSGLRASGLRVHTGIFGAEMAISSVNDGPFTVLLEL